MKQTKRFHKLSARKYVNANRFPNSSSYDVPSLEFRARGRVPGHVQHEQQSSRNASAHRNTATASNNRGMRPGKTEGAQSNVRVDIVVITRVTYSAASHAALASPRSSPFKATLAGS
ncbi:hypothetical protein BaRGS_00039963 [Batillaria attramentaria]|uniref:Uncharacterized protein n=1 Tax=Batillaria attramentaria TaxID=370345 RepID=A0ABD0J1M9_9CAEN